MTTPTAAQLASLVHRTHADPVTWSRAWQPRRKLRQYQQPAALAVADSVHAGAGRTIVATYSRQAGKDEMLAQLIAYLLSQQRYRGGEIVVGLPAISTQGAIAARRLKAALTTLITRGATLSGNRVELGAAGCTFVSADAGAQSRGQTASLLLVANEAQDIDPDLWDARFAPMAASTNATRLVMGTVWSAAGLLHREMTIAAELQQDGTQRLFVVPWPIVAAEVPAYGEYVRGEIARLGREHPFVRTEYDLQPLAGDGGLFPPARQALLRGNYPPREIPHPDELYAGTLDVAGEAEEQIEGEALRRANPRKDSTALTIWRVIPAEKATEHRYEAVARYEWLGTPHAHLHDVIANLSDHWRLRHLVIDSTGVGAGLASFLARRLGESRVTKFVFSSKSKSDLGWSFVAMIEAGRASVYSYPDGTSDALDRRFWQQVKATTYTLLPGPGRLMRWAVPDATVHDDLIISAALVAALDDVDDLTPRTARGRQP